MIGNALGVPKRDIYMGPGFNLFDAKHHPWYEGECFDFPQKSVIKSHELPDSPLISFDADYLHLIRDGRDVVISKYFFERDFYPKNGITEELKMSFDDYVEATSLEWAEYVTAWQEEPVPVIRYEDFLNNATGALDSLLNRVAGIQLSRSLLDDVVNNLSKERLSASLSKVFSHNTFVRKGIAGDWKNYFSERNVAAFKAVAGDALVSLGYEKNLDW